MATGYEANHFGSSHELDARLSAPEELSGVLNKALECLPHVLEHGITETPSMSEALREFRQITDPLGVWLDRNTTTGPDDMVSMSDLRDAYNRDAERRGRVPMSEKAFSHALTQLRPSVKKRQRKYKGKPKTRVYLGIGVKPKGG
jgi:phage/plasmid-associated DNA primase